MKNRYSTLHTLAEAVKDLPNPTAYFCTPREMILRCSYDWATIYSHLSVLEEEKFVQIVHTDTIQCAITKEGMEKASVVHWDSKKKSE